MAWHHRQRGWAPDARLVRQWQFQRAAKRREYASFATFLEENELREMKVFDGGDYGRVSIVHVTYAQLHQN